jgi:undecaprenyl-diphosphatase
MTWLQALLLAIMQGATELFPVSSLGHAVVVPDLLNWAVDERSEAFLPFLVVMHFGTAIALLLFFWRDWFDFGMAVLFNRGPRAADERRLFFRVVVATIPAVLVALAFEKHIRDLFASPLIASIFLLVNGVMLFAAERLKPRNAVKALHRMTVIDALVVGCAQCLALVPGLSRSGSTMIGGYMTGLNHEDAARFSFLTGTPIIVAATVHELPKLVKMQKAAHVLGGGAQAIDLPLSLAAGGVAGVTAFLSLWALMRWFKTHEVKGFDPFAYYCMAFGAIATVINIVAP